MNIFQIFIYTSCAQLLQPICIIMYILSIFLHQIVIFLIYILPLRYNFEFNK